MKKKILIFLLGITTVFSSCDPTEFEDTNVDPTSLKEAPAKTLLTYSLQRVPYLSFSSLGRNEAAFSTLDPNFYSQYLSEGPYPAASWYSVRNFSWAGWYTGPLYNLETIIKYNNEGSSLASLANGSKDNQIAVARILKAYIFWNLTDRFGDLPYSEALKGNEGLQPKFDTQESIYADLFKELKEAQAQIKLNEAGVTGDILLHGDMEGWKRFANTTRLFMALRLMKNDPAKAATEIQAAVADGVITSNDQNIVYEYIAGDPNNWDPWYENYDNDNRNDYALSSRLVDYMKNNADPRLPVYGEDLSGQVVGLSYGAPNARNIPGTYSRIGDAFRNGGAHAPIFTYSQVLFAMAEAANRGALAGGDALATTYFNDAIKASWEYHGVYDAAAYATFIADADIAYVPGAAGLERIINQKWVSQFLNGFEAWTDWRRTGFPVLTAAPNSVDARGIPRRLGYPSNVSALNGKNYAEVVARQGADDNYTRIWWDK
ncbi:MAG TPA: SusD/RagB family nutrient-binding outer membrane lipoprotein [Sphingobacteriaceae bacterium]